MRFLHVSRKGFTLIEVLLYLGLSMIMLAVLGNIGMNVLEGRAKAKAQEDVLRNTTFAFETIQSAFYSSQAVASPVVGDSSPTLSLSMVNTASSTTFAEEDGRLVMYVGEEEGVYLTDHHVSVDVIFSNYQRDATESLRVQLSVAAVTDHGEQYRVASTSIVSTITQRK